VVAIIGAGASGTLAAAHVARAAATREAPTEILLIDPAPAGQGLAYSTRDPRHRLNVPADGMSAWPDDPDHFVAWLRRHVADDYPGDGFAPRVAYAEYLTYSLAEALASAPNVRLACVAARGTDVRRQGRRLRVTLDDGTSRPADAVVIAKGHDVPSLTWAPAALRRSKRFVADPWRDVEANVADDADVLLVGAGLTMLDMAMRYAREGRRVHTVSRHGLLPLPHAAEPTVPAQPDVPLPEEPVTLADARRFVFAHLRATGDWRSGVDGLRAVTTQLWRRMPESARRDFVRTGARRWDRVRHRVAPDIHTWLEQQRADDLVRTHVGEVVAAAETGNALEVTLSDGARFQVGAVVNCTGSSAGVRTSHDPLLMNLLGSGTAEPAALDLGFVTDDAGVLQPVSGAPAPIWAIGPLRKGDLWESTAIPEIRMQAAGLAADVVAALPSPRLVRRARDPYGLPLTANATAASAYVEAVGRVLRVQSGAEDLVAAAIAADPDFSLGHAVHALLGVEWGATVDVAASIAAAEHTAEHADERERRFVEVAVERVKRPGAASAAALLAYIQAYPEDALAVSLAVPTIAFGGATELPAEAWALVEGLEPSYGDDWWYRSMLAFVRQDQGRYEEAAELADAALAREPASGHAVHAKTHAFYETGDHRAGLAWLDDWIVASGAQASHRAHFSWHAALHELALGEDEAARARYTAQLAPPSVRGIRALVDSASLLWRGEMLGAWRSAPVQPVLDTVPRDLLRDPPTPFVAMHAAIALAASGDCGRLAALRRNTAARSDEVFATTVAPLTDALLHLVHGDPDRATDELLALPGVERLGGSAAQREVVEDTLIYCALQARRFELARILLDARLDRRESPRDARRRAEARSARYSGIAAG
jgi:uncharacterized NAD(P)/FAD-binding protein YdhS/tetratricopeptide (TPR) repeat protein